MLPVVRWLLINDTDPAGQLQWLVQQLLEAEKNEEKVWFRRNLINKLIL